MTIGEEPADLVPELRRYLHDLKQPLNVISLACGNIRDRVGSALVSDDADYLDRKLTRIEGQVQRAAEMIESKLRELPRRTSSDGHPGDG